MSPSKSTCSNLQPSGLAGPGRLPRHWGPLIVVASLMLSGCWNYNYARDWGLKPPARPQDEIGRDTHPWIPNKIETKDGAKTSVEDTDYHLSILPGPVAISIRKNPPQSHLVTDRATVRIDLRVGYNTGLPGLAQLASIAILDFPDGPRNQPDLRTMIARLGGSVAAEVGAEWTRFTATVPAINWQSALRALTDHLRRSALTQRQFSVIQERLIQRHLRDWANNPLLSQAAQWVRTGDIDGDAIIQAIEDRNLPEISLFQRRHYQPRGVAIGLWIPNSPKDPKFLVDQALVAVKAWKSGPVPPEDAADRHSSLPSGVKWIEDAGKNSQFALIVPLSPATPEWLTLIECLSMGGIGGRLGTLLKESLEREQFLHLHEVGNYNHRYSLLVGTIPAEKVPLVWSAAQKAWRSLASRPPRGEELSTSSRRARLRLQRRQDHPDSWFEAMGLGLMHRQTGGPIRDLLRIDSITTQTIATVARRYTARSIAMIVTGGSLPEDVGPEFQKITSATPEYHPTAGTKTAAATAKAEQFLELAIQALGDRRQFAVFKGYRSFESWKDDTRLSARVETTYRIHGRMSRELRILNTSIYTSVFGTKQAVKGEEIVGKIRRPLSAGEARNLLNEAASHPIVLIANSVRGTTRFRYVGMRTFEGRRVALLERIDTTQPRLRITIEARTGLLRTVETTLHRSSVGLVQVRETYDDYRRVSGLRVPMHRVSSVDGHQTSESSCRKFEFLR